MVKSNLLISLLSLVFIWLSQTAEATVTAFVSPESGTVGSEITVAGTCTADGVGTKTAVWIDFGDYSTVAMTTSSEEGTFTATFSVPLEPYGTHTITVRTEECGSMTISFFVDDETPPKVTITYPTAGNIYYGSSTGTVVITFTYTEMNYATSTVIVEGIGTASPVVANGYGTATIPFSGLTQIDEGTHTVKVEIRDLANNIGTDTESGVVIDVTKPAVNITSPTASSPAYRTGTNSVIVTFTYTEPNLSTATVSIVGVGTVSPTLSTNQGTATIPFSGLTQGTYTILINMVDRAGNVGTDTEQALVIDTTLPVVNITKPTLDNPAYGTSAGSVVVTFTYTESRISTVTVSIVGEGTVSPTFSAGQGTATIPYTGLTEGTYTLKVEMIDLAGNVGSDTEEALVIDTTPPVINDIDVTSNKPTYFYGPDGVTTGTGGTVYFNSISEEGAGQVLSITADITEIHMATFSGTDAFGDGVQTDTDSPWQMQYSIEADTGSQTVFFTVTDKAGNRATASIAFTQDNTDPNPPTSVQCRPDSAVTIGEFDDDTQIFVTWTNGTDGGAGIREHRMGTSTVATDNSVHSSGDSETGVEGVETFYVFAVDKVGNISSAGSDNITIDLTNPVIDSIAVTSTKANYFYNPGLSATGGTTYFNSLSGEGSGQTLTVTVTWTDTNLGTFSGANAFGDSPVPDTNGGDGWTQVYSVEVNATTQSNSTFTVTDKAGRTDVATITFTQDNTDPNPPTSVQCRPDSAVTTGEFDDDTQIFVTWTNGTDGGAGIREHRMGTSTVATDNSVHSSGDSETGVEGTEIFYVFAVDRVGNISSAATDNITIDLTNPVIDSITVTSTNANYFYNPGLSATGGTTYFNSFSGEGAGQTLTVTVTWTDTNLGTFSGANAFGNSPVPDTNGGDGWTQVYSVEVNATTQSNITFTVTDKAGRTDVATITFTQDNTDPNSPTSVQCRPDSAVTTGEFDDDTQIFVTWTNGTDGGAGIREHRMGTSTVATDNSVHSSGDSETGVEGVETFYVFAVDKVGNISSAGSDNITIDLTNPVIASITVTSTNANYFYNPGLSATGGTTYFNSLSGEGAGQTLTVTVIWTDTNLGTFSGANAFSDSPVPDTNGGDGWTQVYSVETNASTQSNITFTVTDKAGRTDVATITFTQDNIDPTCQVISVTPAHYDPDGIGTNTVGNWYDQGNLGGGWSVNFTASNGGSGLRNGTLTFDHAIGTASDQEINCGTGGTMVIGTLTNNPDGTITVTISVRDNVGNIGTDSLVIRFDNKPPSVSGGWVENSNFVYVDGNGNLRFSNMMGSPYQTAVLKGTVTDAGAGIEKGTATFSSEPSLVLSSPEDIELSNGWYTEYLIKDTSVDTNSPVIVTIYDNVGNYATATYHYKEDLQFIGTITINTKDNTHYEPSISTIDVDFYEELALDSGEYSVNGTSSWKPIPGFSNMPGTTFTTNFTVSLSPGTNTVYFKVKDDAGNIYAPEDDTHTLVVINKFIGTITINTKDNTHYEPSISTIDVDFFEELALDSGWYAINGTSSWQPIPNFSQIAGTSFTSNFTIANLPRGTNTIYFKATDDAGNEYVATDTLILLNIFKGTVTINTPQATWSTTLTPTINVDFYEQLALNSGWYAVNGTTTGDWNSIPNFINLAGTQFTIDFTIDHLNQGTNTIYFKVTDDAGNEYCPEDAAHVLIMKVDSILPTITVNTLDGTWFTTSTPTIDVDFGDNIGLDAGWLRVAGTGTWALIFGNIEENPYIEDFKTSALSEGTNTILFKAKDDVGNIFEPTDEAHQLVIFVDTILPRITKSEASDGSHLEVGIDEDDEVIITFSEKTNKARIATITADNINAILQLSGTHTWTDGKGAIESAPWNDDGTMLTIKLSIVNGVPTVKEGDIIIPSSIITDLAGNPITGTISITGSFSGDVIPPDPPSGLTANGLNPSPWKGTPTFKINWTTQVDIKGAWYKLGTAPTTGIDGTFAGTDTKPFDVNATEEGTQTLYVWLEDGAGNKGTWSIVVLRYDPTPPPAPIDLKADSQSPSPWKVTSSFQINWTNPTDTTSIKGAWYRLNDPPVTQEHGSFTPSTSFDYVVPKEGTYTLYVWLEDNVGNKSHTHTTTVILRYDPGAPTPPLNLTANGYESQTPWTTTSTFKIDWQNPFDTSGIKGAWYNFGTTTGGTFTTSKPFYATITINEGTQTLYVWLEDIAGNKNHGNRNTVILCYDSTPPNPPTNVDDGIPGWYPYSTITFTWTPATDTSGIIYYWYGTGTTDIGTTANTQVTLRGQADGVHTFYVKAVNGAGLVSSQGTHTFYIDVSPPSIVTGITGPIGWTSTTKPEFNWLSATDTLSGIIGYRYRVDGTPSDTTGTITDTTQTTATLGTQTDGPHTFYVRAINGAGVPGPVGSYTFYTNITPPKEPQITSSTHPREDTWYANNTPTFNWTANDISGIIDYQYILLDGTSTTIPNESKGTGTSISYGTIGSGIWYFHIRAQNGAELWSKLAYYRIQVDVTPPTNPATCSAWTDSGKTVPIPNSTWQNIDNEPYLEWSGADKGTGSEIAGYSVYWGTNIAGEPGTKTAPIWRPEPNYPALSVPSPPSPPSIYYLRVRTKDIVGNWSEPETIFTFKYDKTPPDNPISPCLAGTDETKVATITDKEWQNIDADPYFEWSGATDTLGSGVDGYSIYWGTNSTAVPEATITQTVASYPVTGTVSSPSTYYLIIRTVDNVGNWSAASTTFTFKYDSTSPINPDTASCWKDSSKKEEEKIRNDIWQRIAPYPYFEWSGANDGAGSGIAGYSIYWGTSSTGEPGTAEWQTASSYPVGTPTESQSTYTLRVRTRDKVGNWSEPKTIFIFKYDSTPPTNPPRSSVVAYPDETKGTLTIPDNTWQSKYRTPFFEWSGAIDIGSGIGTYSVYWGTSSTGEPESERKTASYTVTTPVGTGTTHFLRIKTYDNAGNWHYTEPIFTFKYGAEPPKRPGSLTANGDNPSPWTQTTTFLIEWITSTHTETVDIIRAWYKIGTSPPTSKDDVTGSITMTVFPPMEKSSFTVTIDNEGLILFLWLEDEQGNNGFENYGSVTLQYDKTPPNNPTACLAWSIERNGGTITNNEWQNIDADPYFEWRDASDGLGSGVAGYSVCWGTSSNGEPGTISVEVVGTSTGTYTVKGTVSSPSIYYLIVRTKDIVGNWSGTKTLFTFRYDATPPYNPGTASCWTNKDKTTPILNDTEQNIDADPYFEWSGANDGLGSGVDGYFVYWGPESLGNPEIWQTATTYTVKPKIQSQELHYLRIKTKDRVGNLSEPKTIFIFKYDTTPPDSITITANETNPSPWTNMDNFLIEWSSTNTGKIITAWYELVNPLGSSTIGSNTAFTIKPLNGSSTITGSFTIQVGTQGIGTLSLWLEEEAGNIGGTSSVKLRYDITPPTIEGLWPNRDEWVSEHPKISAWIRDVSHPLYQGEIGTIAVFIDNNEIMRGTQGFNPDIDQRNLTDKNFEIVAPNPLSSTSHKLEIVVWDKAGNISATTTGTFQVGKIDLINYPNPFSANEGTYIRYALITRAEVTINIYSVALRLINSLEIGTQEPGEYKLKWSGRSDTGELLPNGVYICELVIDGKPQAYCKMAIINH